MNDQDVVEVDQSSIIDQMVKAKQQLDYETSGRIQDWDTLAQSAEAIVADLALLWLDPDTNRIMQVWLRPNHDFTTHGQRTLHSIKSDQDPHWQELKVNIDPRHSPMIWLTVTKSYEGGWSHRMKVLPAQISPEMRSVIVGYATDTTALVSSIIDQLKE